MLQNNFFSFGMLYLLFLHNIILGNRFHSVELLSALLLHQQHCPECSLSQHNLGDKIIESHLLLVVFVEESLCCFSDCLPLVLFVIDVLLVAFIVVQNIFTLQLFGTQFLFVFLGHSVEH